MICKMCGCLSNYMGGCRRMALPVLTDYPESNYNQKRFLREEPCTVINMGL